MDVGVLNQPESRECCECTNEEALTVTVEAGTCRSTRSCTCLCTGLGTDRCICFCLCQRIGFVFV